MNFVNCYTCMLVNWWLVKCLVIQNNGLNSSWKKSSCFPWYHNYYLLWGNPFVSWCGFFLDCIHGKLSTFFFRRVEWVLSLEKHHPIPNEEIWRLHFTSKQVSITFNIPWKKQSNYRQEDVVNRGIEIACPSRLGLYSRIISTWGPQFAVHRANSVASSQGIKFIIYHQTKSFSHAEHTKNKLSRFECFAHSFFYHQKRICKVFALLFTCFPIKVFPWCSRHIIIFS